MSKQNVKVYKHNIVEGLNALGLSTGDVVLVHSSLSKFGKVVGGAQTIISAILEVIGKQGTLCAPTLTGNSQLSINNPPIFDVRNSGCWTGVIPYTLLSWPGAVRSLNPTHSVVAVGKHAKVITAGHEKCLVSCNKKSPYYKIAKLGGYVLFLGVGLECNTTFHTVEEIVNVKYHLQKQSVHAVVYDYNGEIRIVKNMLHKYGTPRQFGRIEPLLLEKGIMRKTVIGNAEVRLVKSLPMIELAVKMLKENNNYFVKKVINCKE
ncbi:MAG: AAC(3) family N-acetyltransferase [Elusimicrobiota bacterium]